MIPKISKIAELKENTSTAVIFDNIGQFPFSGFTGDEKKYVAAKLEKNTDCIIFKYPNLVFFYKAKEEKEKYIEMEKARIAGSKLFDALKEEKIETVQLQISAKQNWRWHLLKVCFCRVIRSTNTKKRKMIFC